MSFGCWQSNKYIHRPDDNTDFWYIPYEFAIPLLSYDTYISRFRCEAGMDFAFELLNMFSPELCRECFAFCDDFYGI